MGPSILVSLLPTRRIRTRSFLLLTDTTGANFGQRTFSCTPITRFCFPQRGAVFRHFVYARHVYVHFHGPCRSHRLARLHQRAGEFPGHDLAGFLQQRLEQQRDRASSVRRWRRMDNPGCSDKSFDFTITQMVQFFGRVSSANGHASEHPVNGVSSLTTYYSILPHVTFVWSQAWQIHRSRWVAVRITPVSGPAARWIPLLVQDNGVTVSEAVFRVADRAFFPKVR